ncbi:hypothetical protein PRIPAC_98105 [Pristionchus pacificus]|uniref:Uncharacterized protein n=1 Tax=Pristionchus pacificus TaxID=54126 RepID=A0A2A6B3I3_PRIPA|nr:hypothetical protein PRIPAC_98105 [Pristionchus pacificus]|eukprot:PDM60434.1 hypothetical protein PRIPAC_50560 [Pristionchus pacificus]
MPIGRKKLSQIVYSENVELEEICSHIPCVRCNENCGSILINTTFCLLPSSRTFQWRLLSSLRAGCIPVVLSNTQPFPFHKELDWKLASLRYPLATMRFVPQLLERLSKEDILELRRRGRIFLERLDNAQALADALVAALSDRIMVELPTILRGLNDDVNELIYFFKLAQAASHSESITEKASTLSRSLPPPSSLYSYRRWNNGNKLTFAPSLLHDVPMMPGGAAFHKGTKEKVVAMNSEIGSRNSNDALGLTRDEEQFTVVILTYDRVDGVTKIFNTLRNCPFLNKIIVVWNNNNSSPPADWLDMNDPFEIIMPKKNSLNNRFIPYESIETEAVISMDDDVYVTQSELVFAFRMWRENRNRIVGFPERYALHQRVYVIVDLLRYHTKVNSRSKYGLTAHHEYSMILTGLAIIHKEFLFEFTYNQHPAILEYIDDHFNCEDIAMNYLVAHLTRRAPLRVQKKTSLSNGSKVGLFSRTLHVRERDECMDMLNEFYGYNPLFFHCKINVHIPHGDLPYSAPFVHVETGLTPLLYHIESDTKDEISLKQASD